MNTDKKFIRALRKYFLPKVLNITALIFVFALGSVVSVHSASISGTVFDGEGSTPITGEVIYISVYTGDPDTCSFTFGHTDLVHSSNGEYIVDGLSAGTYYLHAEVAFANYIDEWWASSASTTECTAAGPITVSDGAIVTGKHFQLDSGGTISGIVYQNGGITPITNTNDIWVDVYEGEPCGAPVSTRSGLVNSDGTYAIESIPAGDYYLRAKPTPQSDSYFSYLLEWISSINPPNSPKCSDAIPISITTGATITRDFQLSTAQSGDVNRDGDVSLFDAIITLQNLTGQNENPVELSGDVNNDDRISIPEAIYILKASAQ